MLLARRDEERVRARHEAERSGNGARVEDEAADIRSGRIGYRDGTYHSRAEGRAILDASMAPKPVSQPAPAVPKERVTPEELQRRLDTSSEPPSVLLTKDARKDEEFDRAFCDLGEEEYDQVIRDVADGVDAYAALEEAVGGRAVHPNEPRTGRFASSQ